DRFRQSLALKIGAINADSGNLPALCHWSRGLLGRSFFRREGALGAFGFGAASDAALRALAGARGLPPRARLASNRPTACSSVIVSGVRSAGSVALTPSWVASGP